MLSGALSKMRIEPGKGFDDISSPLLPAQYFLRAGDKELALNDFLGKRIRLKFLARISCSHCGRVTPKSYSQGYCYPCFRKLAACDMCIVKPSQCHFAAGTCREPEWAATHCMTQHVVYLANSTGIKVGITRSSQMPTRWLDQGAIQALPLFQVESRRLSGLLEDMFAEHVTDRTQWQALLKSAGESLDISDWRERLLSMCASTLDDLQQQYPGQIQPWSGAEQRFDYPVQVWPEKIRSIDLEKAGELQGELQGIKGQYLILDCGVINIRKYTSYHVEFSAE